MSYNPHHRGRVRKAETANKKAKEAAASTHSNEGGNDNNPTAIHQPKKRSYRPQPVYQVIRKARNLQLKQLEQSGKSKAACLEAIVKKCDDIYPDALRFYMDFREERERLTDSIRFNDACKAKGLEPQEVADHVVFEGKATVEKVLKEGLQVLGEKVQMFNCPLWTDKFKLFSQPAEQQTPAAPEQEVVTGAGANE